MVGVADRLGIVRLSARTSVYVRTTLTNACISLGFCGNLMDEFVLVIALRRNLSKLEARNIIEKVKAAIAAEESEVEGKVLS
jgi:hypothetical protein